MADQKDQNDSFTMNGFGCDWSYSQYTGLEEVSSGRDCPELSVTESVNNLMGIVDTEAYIDITVLCRYFYIWDLVIYRI